MYVTGVHAAGGIYGRFRTMTTRTVTGAAAVDWSRFNTLEPCPFEDAQARVTVIDLATGAEPAQVETTTAAAAAAAEAVPPGRGPTPPPSPPRLPTRGATD